MRGGKNDKGNEDRKEKDGLRCAQADEEGRGQEASVEDLGQRKREGA